GGVGTALAKSPGTLAEERLEDLSGRRKTKGDEGIPALLKAPAIDPKMSQGWFGKIFSVEGLERLYEQADVGMSFTQVIAIAAVLAVSGALVGLAVKLPPLIIPVGSAFLGGLPFLWLVLRKRKRIKKFTAQMPDALELVSRALRAGHGLASGLGM